MATEKLRTMRIFSIDANAHYAYIGLNDNGVSPIKMTDEEFHAHWDALLEEAAQAGDEDRLEELMDAYNQAFIEREEETR